MENGTVQKSQNLLEDFVWLIDNGRLMGDPSYSSYVTTLRPDCFPSKSRSTSSHDSINGPRDHDSPISTCS